MHRYTEYGWLRGFNVVPSWGARIEEAWWRYDPRRFREEIAPAKLFHANALRLWVDYPAWMADPESVTAAFMDAVAAIAEAGMKTMPCLFNRWHSAAFDYGGIYRENLRADIGPYRDYVRTLVAPLAADDRILAWDLCNEPECQNAAHPDSGAEFHWLAAMADAARCAGARQPITIGTHGPGDNIEFYAPLVDVLCCHPYPQDMPALETALARYRRIQDRWRKPMLCNETGPGGLDDRERAAWAEILCGRLAAAGYGWMGWALRPGKAMATRQDRMDSNGLHGQGYHPWTDASGRPRAGLEWMTRPPARQAPWWRRATRGPGRRPANHEPEARAGGD